MPTASEFRQLALDYKAQAKEIGITSRRAALLRNIAHSYSGLAHQLDMLAEDVEAERRDLSQNRIEPSI
ncbi:hypothetical protein LRP30_33930 [Bradyrhizobium sp. C-145]|uniref:hypothetical protein n=1 Tax=Bradyrhizobium sp. C-145 TaxID=574727 RepID=UPI00201B7660|nr:hypothetical protein [Bradyrhizobium sp. C-145]UQR61762.1 hypothetical protein LRP30_33930 [Bradyrhizobium sp. C-145]